MWTFTNEFTDDSPKGNQGYNYNRSFKSKFRY
jgi:hypothetical protein